MKKAMAEYEERLMYVLTNIDDKVRFYDDEHERMRFMTPGLTCSKVIEALDKVFNECRYMTILAEMSHEEYFTMADIVGSFPPYEAGEYKYEGCWKDIRTGEFCTSLGRLYEEE